MKSSRPMTPKWTTCSCLRLSPKRSPWDSPGSYMRLTLNNTSGGMPRDLMSTKELLNTSSRMSLTWDEWSHHHYHLIPYLLPLKNIIKCSIEEYGILKQLRLRKYLADSQDDNFIPWIALKTRYLITSVITWHEDDMILITFSHISRYWYLTSSTL